MDPSVSTTARVLGSSPSPSNPPGWPSTSWISSLNSRILVSWRGAPYQRSKTLISHPAYPVPGGAELQLACGRSRSRAGGLNFSSASYVLSGSFATSMVHRMPLEQSWNSGDWSKSRPRATASKLLRPLA